MTAALLTNGRYHVLSGGLPHPGQCAMCSEANRPVVTFSFQIPRYGTFMMCTECFKSCVRDLSPVLGFVSKDIYDAMLEEYKKEIAENDRYREVFASVGPSIMALVTERLSSAGIAVTDTGVTVELGKQQGDESTPAENSADGTTTEVESFFLFGDSEDIFRDDRGTTEAD